MVKKSRQLKTEQGILADPSKKKGKNLEASVTERVRKFYQSDEYSRICPDKKDFVTVAIDGERQHVQKRLLLVNLKELHLAYVAKTADKISLSKFCELRPSWCLPVTSRGMHSVCVCEYHHNVKLQIWQCPKLRRYVKLLHMKLMPVANKCEKF